MVRGQHRRFTQFTHPAERFGVQGFGDAVAHVHFQRLSFAPAIQAHGTGVPGGDVAIQVLHGDGIKRIAHHHGQTKERIGLLQRVACAHGLGDVDKGDHHAFNHVVQRAVGQDAQGERLAVAGLHIRLFGHQGGQHLFRIFHQAGIAIEVGHDVGNRAANITQDQVDDLCGRRREAQNAQLLVHKHSRDAGAGQQVVHVVVGARKIRHLALQLGVDGGQLFVDRLQFFFGGLHLFIGGLQLFVDGLHFLVGRFQLFVRRFQLFIGGVQVLLFGPQLFVQVGNLGGGARTHGLCLGSWGCRDG